MEKMKHDDLLDAGGQDSSVLRNGTSAADSTYIEEFVYEKDTFRCSTSDSPLLFPIYREYVSLEDDSKLKSGTRLGCHSTLCSKNTY